MRDFDLTTLRLYVAVCETRNIRQAAAQANLVASALSKRLAQLEEMVGTPLLLRRRHGVEPTVAGEALLEHARGVLGALERISQDMAGFTGSVRGQVRVLCTSSVLAESLAQDVSDFLQGSGNGGIQVALEEHVSHGVVRGVREGSASLGLCWNAVDMKGLQSQPYRCDHLVVVVHPTHPLARHRKLRFEQTLPHEQVGLTANTALAVLLQRAAASVGLPLLHRIVVSNFDASLRVVQANLAMSIVPVEAVGLYAEAAGLVVIPLTDAWAARQFVVCFKDRAALSAPALLLADHLSRR